MEFIQQIFQSDFAELPTFALFLAFFFATFISEDAACLSAGALAGRGKISLALAITACFTGILAGDVLLYWAGRIFGRRICETRYFRRFVSANVLERSSLWLEKRGAAAVFLSRFISGLRLPTYLAAGFLRMNFLKFFLYFFLASLIWTPILIGSTAFSQNFLFSNNLLFGIILLFAGFKIFLHFLSWKNRRIFYGRLKRFRNWEFWSVRIFYIPVVLYIFGLVIKHRSLTAFTAANPAIPAGGFIGESKDEIYRNLYKSSATRAHLLQYAIFSPEESMETNLQKATDFISENELEFPLIFKPDAGERGAGVKILKDFSEFRNELEKLEKTYILQEFANGVEASVFYFRLPNENKGKIFSITEKRFPELRGNEKSDLETLILKDERAVCLAKKYFEQNAEKLNYVPSKDEKIRIINIGTHSRGAIFLDGEWLRSVELENKIDEICLNFEGFYFGRFDLRANSFDELQRGENFKIIELNGVTSEATNIYDPKYSLFNAYRILFAQWRIAFEIGLQNCSRGVQSTSFFRLLKLVFENW